MKGRAFERLTRRYLLPDLRGFRAKNGWLVHEQQDYLVRGFASQSSSYSAEDFTVWAFVHPLYIPSDHIGMTVGGRLGHLSGRADRWWTITAANEAEIMCEVRDVLLGEGLPYLEQFRTLEGFIERAEVGAQVPDDVHLLEAMCYALILVGRYADALDTWVRLYAALRSVDSRISPWIGTLIARADSVGAALRRNPAEAVKLLHKWRDQSRNVLRLDTGWKSA